MYHRSRAVSGTRQDEGHPRVVGSPASRGLDRPIWIAASCFSAVVETAILYFAIEAETADHVGERPGRLESKSLDVF